MSYTFTQTELGAGNIQLDVLWSVNAQNYILQSNLQFPQLLRTIFDVADTLAAGASVPDYRLLRPAPATDAVLSNVAAGSSALASNITGTNNTAIGVNALAQNTANDNTAVGASALQVNTTGVRNVAVGVQANYLNQIGVNNTAVGYAAIKSNVSGSSNTGVGTSALETATGNENTGIGFGAGFRVTTGQGNTFLGAFADLAVGGGAREYNVVLGRSANAPNLNGTLSIGGTGTTAMANLNVATAGGAAVGEYLNIYLNGVQRKIALLLP